MKHRIEKNEKSQVETYMERQIYEKRRNIENEESGKL